MMKQFTYILTFVCALALVGCSELTKNNYDWGKQVHYPNFPLCKFVPDTLYKTLSIDESNARVPFELQLRKKKDGQHVAVNVNEVQLYADSEKCDNNIVTIHPGQKKIRLGLVFSDKAEEGKYQWCFMVHKANQVEVFNGQTSDKEIFSWTAKKKCTMNPLALALLLVAIVFGVFVLAWFAFLRRLCIPTFTFDNMQVLYFDGENRAGREDLSIKGARKIICSSSPKVQGGFNRFVFGRIEYLTNSFWTNTVEMKPCDLDQISVQEEMSAENVSETYRMNYQLSSVNGPKKPFVVKKKNTELIAKISVG